MDPFPFTLAVVVASMVAGNRLHDRALRRLPDADRDLIQFMLRWQWLAIVGFGACVLAEWIRVSAGLHSLAAREGPVLIGLMSSGFVAWLRRRTYQTFRLATEDCEDVTRANLAAGMLVVTTRAFGLSLLGWLVVAGFRA